MHNETSKCLCQDCTLMLHDRCLYYEVVGEWTNALDHIAEIAPPRPMNGKSTGRLRYWAFRLKNAIFEITIRYLRRNGKCQK